ncbi:hypothetical protein RAZWK3B_16935 [Roseobacter sp. AzwK-3b]|uniref:AAA family ATPase n=1 Tax=Roseobacter sp. AzwK-3b TaxID=351016 RepID=UPI0001569AF7|nr:AAA family ATPase [Roseobacter sp. AzwK-3b]EDM71102.1 hypothetical protein RAZWK3B_16935 [Roseobacter sp. AzwK-3b]
MRLNRLDLTRYGKFTDVSLAFPSPANDGADLHVIYGPNEAGKSTLLEGWLDFLFQIPVQSRMAFLHSYQAMQLGAALEIDGRRHDLVRVKKRDASLLDKTGAPVGEALLHAGLRGLDRASYAAMFSLNRQTLDEGGESILASKGDLGELLFQASAGLTDLATQLDDVRTESETFLNKTGRKGALRELGAAFDDLGRQIKELDTAAAEYARLSADRDSARNAWQDARQAVETAQAGVIETERLSSAIPLLPRLERLDAQIAGYGALPDPPEGWLAELPELDRTEAAITTRLETAKTTVAGLDAELRDCVPDRPVLDLRESIAEVETLKSAYDEAIKDLPKRNGDLALRTEAMQQSLSRLGQTGVDPVSLLPDARTLGRIRDLIERHSGLQTARETAQKELEDARAALNRAAQRLQEAGGNATDLGGLDGLVQGIRRDDPTGACDRAQERTQESAAELHAALANLAPWTGDAAALTDLKRPDHATLERLETDIAKAGRDAERAQDRLDQLGLALQQARAKRDAIGSKPVVTIEEAAQIRSRREAEWSRHRAALTEETADRFEEALRLDDQVTATLAQHRAQAEKAAGADRELAEAEGQVAMAQEHSDHAKSRHHALALELGATVAAISGALPTDMDMQALRAWLDRLDAAQKAADIHERALREQARQEHRVARARADLLGALNRMGGAMPDDTGLAPALEAAQSLLDRATQIEALQETVAQSQQDLTRRDAALQSATDALADWHAAWEATCAETWMAGTSLSVAEMRAILEELNRLRDHHRDVADLAHRVQTMQANIDRFEEAVAALADQLGVAVDDPVPDRWRTLTTRLSTAKGEESQRADIEKRLMTARQSLGEIEEQARLHHGRTDEFVRYFGAANWAEARDALTSAGDVARLRAARRDLAEDLCARMRSSTVDEARTRLDGIDADALAARAESLRNDLERLRATQEDAQDKFRKATEAVDAVGGDGAVARLDEQRQTLLLEMEEGARRHLRQRLGILAVDAALGRYRDTHRSGMLDQASEAFRIMSRNRYSGLAAQPDGSGEILVALATDGGSKHADQLSEGARAQLYLALRIAGYHEFVRNSGPVPFIADDIMESFDDHRAAEAFGLLAKMSKSGQVIYLTHHAHLRDMARDVCPDVHIHELPE